MSMMNIERDLESMNRSMKRLTKDKERNIVLNNEVEIEKKMGSYVIES